MRLEAVLPLRRGSAVGPDDRRIAAIFVAPPGAGPVEIGGDRQAVPARERQLPGHDQAILDRLHRHRIGQPGRLPRCEGMDNQIPGASRRLEGVGDAAAVRRPLRRTDDSGLGSRYDARLSATRRRDSELVGAPVVLDVREPSAVGGPGTFRLVGLGRHQRPGFSSRPGHAPVVDPPGAVGRKDHRGAVRGDQGIAERAPLPVVEEVLVAHDDPLFTAVGRDFHNLMVHPFAIESDEQDRPGIGAPGGIDLQFGSVGQPASLPGRDLHRPHVVLPVTIAGERDPAPVRRPGVALDQPPAVPGDAERFASGNGPEPDLRRAAPVRYIGDPLSVRRPLRLGRRQKMTAASRGHRQFADRATFGTDEPQVRATQEDPVTFRGPARRLATHGRGERQESLHGKRFGCALAGNRAEGFGILSGCGGGEECEREG